MSVERESKTQSKCMSIAKKYGSYVYKNAQNMYTEKGRPDLSLCIPVTLKRLNELYNEDDVIGIFAGVELKRPGRLNGVSEAQKVVGNQIKKAGGIWLLIDDPDLMEALMIKFTGEQHD